ncbi:tyrosine-protein phosphatase [Gottfriedia acidiceleris]|uniref:tyrosine-protein phosphatase n=1 Tax=Gottfriedia acidiceleris TaxID=371036 RepID=UPI003D1CBB40
MIDIHCHILPGVDDGAKTMEDSLSMARSAVDEGVRTIVASPHHQNGKYINDKEDIEHLVIDLQNQLNEAQIPLQILAGQEVRAYGDLIEDIKRDEILTLGNKYVLVEFPSNHVPRYTEKLFYDLQLEKKVPIIVHPERNTDLMKNPDVLLNLVEKGALTQLTASSLVGKFGKNIQQFSRQLIEANLTHFIASDAHNTTSRGFYLQDAFNEIEKRYGSHKVFEFRENAEALLDGRVIYPESPKPVKKKSIFSLFL